MKQVISYIFAIGGLVLMVLGFNILNLGIPFLEGDYGNYVAGVGVAAIIVGVVLNLGNKRFKKKISNTGKDEIPIYEGVGKKRRIVGYRKD